MFKRHNIIFLFSVFLFCACASTTQTEAVRPDAALQTAIAANDCKAVYQSMSDDIKDIFNTSESFCNYYSANRTQFEVWAAQLDGSFAAGDYRHFAYLKDDPQGAYRLEYADNTWKFEDDPKTVNFVEPADLRERFQGYLSSRRFLQQLSEFVEGTQPDRARQIMAYFRQNTNRDNFVFAGPFAVAVIGENLTIRFVYKKQGASEGAWEIYRCHLNL